MHDPGKILTDLTMTLALGGDCLADVAVLRAEPGLAGPVASDPVISRLVAALAAEGPRALRAYTWGKSRYRCGLWWMRCEAEDLNIFWSALLATLWAAPFVRRRKAVTTFSSGRFLRRLQRSSLMLRKGWGSWLKSAALCRSQ